MPLPSPGLTPVTLPNICRGSPKFPELPKPVCLPLDTGILWPLGDPRTLRLSILRSGEFN